MSITYIKAVGVTLVLVGATIMNSSHKKALKASLLSTDDLIGFVRFASDAIRHRALPIPDILSAYSLESEHFGDFYSSAALSSLEDELSRRDDLDKKILDIMLAYAKELGHGFKDTELSLCELTLSRLTESRRLLAESIERSCSVFAAAITFASASLLLLFI